MNQPRLKLTKLLYDLDGNGLEIMVLWDPEYKSVETILSCCAVRFNSTDTIDITDIMLEHLGLDKIVEGIDWSEMYKIEKEERNNSSLFQAAKDAIIESASHY